jgi:hypothetical protein
MIKIEKILNLLKARGGQPIHLRGIEKTLKIHPQTITRILDNYLAYFIETKIIEQYGFKARLVWLKPGRETTTLDDVLRYYEVKKKIRI